MTARLHFANMDVWTGDSWCYVGSYGESGQDRCTITQLDDGVEFRAEELTRYETLTFDVEIRPGSFVRQAIPDNYAYVVIAVVLGAICFIWILYAAIKYVKIGEKRNYYKGFFVKPEYQPSGEYSLPEMAEIYLGKKKDAKVAMLLELVVRRKIELVKGEKKKWSIRVKNLEGVGEEYMDLLAILNGGTRPAEGDEIEVKSRAASNRLITLKKSMEAKIVGDLKGDKLVENKYHFGSSGGHGATNAIMISIITIPVVAMLGLVVLSMLDDVMGLSDSLRWNMVFERQFFPTAFAMIAVTVVVWAFLSEGTQKYAGHTLKGLEASRYMDGLKLYIEMAEADRLKMLQSVKGADTSAEGIVKLYEKLLPYAAVFGLEESWMSEMKKYCEVKEIEEPDYLMTGLAASEIARGFSQAATYATVSTTMSSSGGGSSSGFSGGGGGGFSGGGGGGGGFSGR